MVKLVNIILMLLWSSTAWCSCSFFKDLLQKYVQMFVLQVTLHTVDWPDCYGGLYGQNSSQNPKHVPKSKITSQSPKTPSRIKNMSQNPKTLPRIQNTFQKPKTHPRIQNTSVIDCFVFHRDRMIIIFLLQKYLEDASWCSQH